MLQPTTKTLRPAVDPPRSSRGYSLSDVTLDIPSSDTAIFRAKLNGPAGAKVWVRAWLSSEIDGMLAAFASNQLRLPRSTLSSSNYPMKNCDAVSSSIYNERFHPLKWPLSFLISSTLAWSCFTPILHAVPIVKAFPTAEGFGANAIGGR